MTAKTGNDEVNRDRGAHNESKTKREEAETESRGPQEHPRGIAIIGPGLPLGRNVGMYVCKTRGKAVGAKKTEGSRPQNVLDKT